MLRALGIPLAMSLTAGAAGFLARALFPAAWERWARRAFVVAWGAGAASIALWRAGRELDVDVVARVGATAGGAVLASSVALFLTSPLWGTLGAALRRRP